MRREPTAVSCCLDNALPLLDPAAELAKYKSRHIDLEAVIDTSDAAKLPLDPSLFASVEQHDHRKALPFNNESYQVVASLLPPERSRFSPSLTEIGRILKEDGYALIGASESVWKEERLVDSLQSVPECTLLSALDVNCGRQPMREWYYLAVLVKKTFDE